MDTPYNSENLLYKNNFIDEADLEEYTSEEKQRFIELMTSKRREEEKIKTVEVNDILPKRIEIQKKQSIIIDSNYRNKKLYPDPNSFTYNFKNSFNNVTSIKLIKTVFPNTDSVIKNKPASAKNNKISWINEEDYVINYPVYSIEIRPGTYNAFTIQEEIVNKMNFVKRESDGGFHNFELSLDLDTDVVTFVSLKKRNIGLNNISTIEGYNYISVNQLSHSFLQNQTVYMSGIKLSAGISASSLNGSFRIILGRPVYETPAPTEEDPEPSPIILKDSNNDDVFYDEEDWFTYEVNQQAAETLINTGGNTIMSGTETPFKFLWGLNNPSTSGNISFNLGFLEENSSEIIPNINPITTISRDIISINPLSATETEIRVSGDTSIFSIGNKICLENVNARPDSRIKPYIITNINGDTLTIDTGLIFLIIGNNPKAHFNIINVNFTDHNFNEIINVNNTYGLTPPEDPNGEGIPLIEVDCLYNHDILTGDTVYLSFFDGTNNGSYKVYSTSASSFVILNPDSLIFSSTGYLGNTQEFDLYNIKTNVQNIFGGLEISDVFSNVKFSIFKIIDKDNFLTETVKPFTTYENNGGDKVKISSYRHGFSGVLTNQDDENELNRPISLEGTNYVYMCCPELERNFDNNNNINNVFGVILLNEPAGSIIFNSFVDSPKIYYDSSIPVLDKLTFQIKNPDGSLYNFNNMNYSFGLEINTIEDKFENLNISSQRGF